MTPRLDSIRSGPWSGLTAFVVALFLIGNVQAQTETEAIDPPGRVGRISLLAGPVTLTDLRSGEQEPAVLNWPISSAYRLSTARQGRAEVRIGSTALRLDEETTVDFARIDDRLMQIAVLGGSLAVRVRNREVLGELELLTQRERIVLDDVGRYRIDVDRVAGVTAVSAPVGRARVASGESSFVIGSGQRGELTAPPLTRLQLVPIATDRFDDWVASRDARDDSILSAGYASREMTGIEVLDDYGDWRSVESYGSVWFPRDVPGGWAPYRHGRWSWIAPWGWTWIDEAPWGFAPFHYGRWAVIGGVWGWVPGLIVPWPVYAPALVAWFDTPGISVGIGAPIGWFPLGPREVYLPPHRHSPRYLRVVNVQNVPNVEHITIVQTPRYVNRHPDRSTWVPGDRFGKPDPVRRAQRPPPSEWRQYIGTPQPPRNVPGTKRRQHEEMPQRAIVAPQLAPAAPPSVRPPTPVAPPPVHRPAPTMPRAVQPPPAAREAPSPRGRGDFGAPGDERRTAPRAPATPVVPLVQPPTPAAPSAAQPPAAVREAPGVRGRGEAGVPGDDRRFAPRAPAAPGPVPTPPPASPERAQPRERVAPPDAQRQDPPEFPAGQRQRAFEPSEERNQWRNEPRGGRAPRAP